jgi:mono/diheme cytochrome c family protein
MCIDCHSERDWTKYSGPVKPGTEGKGGDKFDENFGFPGTIYVRNITPASLGTWSDGEIIRAITCGVNKKGDALFPVMPYNNLNELSEEDLYSIVAYLKSLKPIKNEIPDKELNFPLNFIEKSLPLKTYIPKESINKSDKINYGKYLVTIASCGDCHTPSVEGKPDFKKQFAGGNEFPLPWGIVRPANITPDIETGIGNWTKEQFIAKFKYYDSESAKNISVAPGEFNSVMPWSLYSGMTEEDLSAIYEYLRTVSPVKNLVQKWTPPQEDVAKK